LQRKPNTRLLFFRIYPKDRELTVLFGLIERLLSADRIALESNNKGIVTKVAIDGHDYAARGRNQLNKHVLERGIVYCRKGAWTLRVEATPPQDMEERPNAAPIAAQMSV
jgi:hypothetical protein